MGKKVWSVAGWHFLETGFSRLWEVVVLVCYEMWFKDSNSC